MQSQPQIDISSPVVATATFDPPVIRPGEKCIYRVSFNALEASIRWPQPLRAPPQLQVRPGAHGQVLRPGNGVWKPLTTFNFEVRATAPGFFLLPRFTVEVYGQPVLVPDAGLEVATDLEAHEPPRQLLLEPAATNLFVGQAMTVRVILPATGTNPVEVLKEVQLNGDGFVVDKAAVRQSMSVIEHAGRRVPGFIYETTVTPIAAGTQPLAAQGFSAGRDFGGPLVITGTGPVTLPGGAPQYLLLQSEPVNLQVRLLPTAGQLPGFNGAIGQFASAPPQLATNRLRLGEPVDLLVTLRGEPLARLQPPEPPRTRGWQIFPGVPRGFVPASGPTNAGAVFAYALVPLAEDVTNTPPIPFSYFDPGSARYVDATIPAIPVTVVPDANFTNNSAVADATPATATTETKLRLSPEVSQRGKTVSRLQPLQSRAWFIVLQATPVLGFAALWQWDRRRRYLEQHPEIRRRRQARRDLRQARRELGRARAASDAHRFTATAVHAMQVACAPHFPAHPRALVCADVVSVLPENERDAAANVVRRFFAAADSASFATTADDPASLLALQPGLDEVLLKLEARL
jgi:antitoxin (DNA-binding transcriptional repressor) of toxin-antitoxin stability system